MANGCVGGASFPFGYPYEAPIDAWASHQRDMMRVAPPVAWHHTERGTCGMCRTNVANVGNAPCAHVTLCKSCAARHYWEVGAGKPCALCDAPIEAQFALPLGCR